MCRAGLGGDEVDVGGAGADVDDLLASRTTLAEVRRRRLRRRHLQIVVTLACTRAPQFSHFHLLTLLRNDKKVPNVHIEHVMRQIFVKKTNIAFDHNISNAET